jgi:hypothetical protein
MDQKDNAADNDKRLDTPSELNREKHINFMEVEESTGYNKTTDRQVTEQRKEEWEKGLEEGQNQKRNEGGAEEQVKNRQTGGKNETLGIP